MTAAGTNNSSSNSRPADADRSAGSLYATITRLAKSSASLRRYLTGALQAVLDGYGGGYAMMYLRGSSEVTQLDLGKNEQQKAFWRPAVERLLTTTLTEQSTQALYLRGESASRASAAVLGAPMQGADGQTVGALALSVAVRDRADAQGKLTRFEAIADYISFCAGWVGNGPAQSSNESAGQSMSKIGPYESPEELAYAITNGLRTKLGCEHVSLGLVERRCVRILSLSGFDKVAKQSSSVRDLHGAMEECLDAECVITAQDAQAWADQVHKPRYRLHEQWRAGVGNDAVASIPLLVGDKIAAILSLRRTPDRPFTEEEIDAVRQRVEQYAPALRVLRVANRGLAAHCGDSVIEGARAIMAPGQYRRKLLFGVGLAVMCWFLFGTTMYVVTVPCDIEPVYTRHVSAPFDAMLAGVDVEEGSVVSKGEVLCRLDSSMLEKSRDQLLAEIAVLEAEKDRARAEGDAVASRLADAKQRHVSAKLALVNSQIERSVVRAGISGIVVSGDLQDRVGSVMTKGDALFAIAPREGWKLSMRVPERDVNGLREGLAGDFAPLANPMMTRSFVVNMVGPRAQVIDGKNVCVTEADVDLPMTWMKPGMEGIARIEVGKRRVWWVSLHRMLDYVRLHLWF